MNQQLPIALPVERDYSLPDAIGAGMSLIRSLDLSVEVEHLDPLGIVCEAKLLSRSGSVVAGGMGKGHSSARSEASAIFEALEHYFSSPAAVEKGFIEALEGAIDDLATPILANDDVIQRMLTEVEPEPLLLRAYSLAHESGFQQSSLLYPLFLSVPELVDAPQFFVARKWEAFTKYASNSGTAIGCSYAEAIVHAVCELIERDAHSLFLLSLFFTSSKPEYRIVKPDELPASLGTLVEYLCTQSGELPLIIDITSDLGVPTYCAALTGQPTYIQPAGFGTSLNASYAVERALLECIQIVEIYKKYRDEENRRDVNVLRQFQGIPKYQECIEFSLRHRIVEENAEYVTVPIDASMERMSVTEQAKKLLAILVKSGYTPFVSKGFYSDPGVCCLHALVPGLERFNLISQGMPVIPSRRGRGYLASR